LYVFIVATRKRRAPAKSDRLIGGLVSQFVTSQNVPLRLLLQRRGIINYLLTWRKGKHREVWPSGWKRGSVRRGCCTWGTPIPSVGS